MYYWYKMTGISINETSKKKLVTSSSKPEQLSQNDNNDVKIIKKKIEDEQYITLDECSYFVNYLILSK